jgi:hypothetical protein
MQQSFRTIRLRCQIFQHNHNNRRRAINCRIRAFLSGETHGADVLEALYGKVADEPVPERLRAILKP